MRAAILGGGPGGLYFAISLADWSGSLKNI